MPEKLWKCVEEWILKGAIITYDEADRVYQHCLRKMEVAKIENPDEYIYLLFPDEIKDFLFRRAINAKTMLMKMGLEANGDVCNMQTSSLSSEVS